MTFGPLILSRSLSTPTAGTNGYAHGNSWQYHPRSDRHSKVACWAVFFDLMLRQGALFRHISEEKVAFGINHQMRDFQHDRQKNLDLVICRRSTPQKQSGLEYFHEMVEAYQIELNPAARMALQNLPKIPLTGVQTALIALEAKAAFTEFGKARPRLYDELNSSHLTIHGDTDQAIAAGLALINASATFISPLRNPWPLGKHPTVVNAHKQPRETENTIAKVKQLPRRAAAGQRGFDAMGVVVVSCKNDNSPVQLIGSPPGPSSTDAFHYDNFIERIDTIYAARFGSL
jgi:hypothetical protein